MFRMIVTQKQVLVYKILKLCKNKKENKKIIRRETDAALFSVLN